MGEPRAVRPGHVTVVVPNALRPLLYVRWRRGPIAIPNDGVSTIGHIVGSVGIPPTEVGALILDGDEVSPSARPSARAVVAVRERARPQPTPTTPPRFVLDVHLGTLARRLRLLGLDTAWHNDASDDELVAKARAERRVLLTRDRGLLMRKAAADGGYARGNDPARQLDDVIDRFAPALQPWTRCTACNGLLAAVPKADVIDEIQPGTRRNFERFERCAACGRVYWNGAHHARLEAIVARYVR
jgi:uncharacterized protein with PIN domain